MPAADEDEPVGTVAHRLAEPGQVVDDRLRQQFDLAAAGLERLRQTGGERAQVDAVRVREESLKGQPVGSYAETVAVGTQAQHHVQPSLGPGVARELGGHLTRIPAVDGRVGVRDGLAEGLVDDHRVHGGGVGAVHAARGEDQPGQDLGLGHPAGLQRDRGAGVADLVADGEGVEREVVVRALGGRGRRQHHVGVARGLVEVRVDAHHEVQ